MLHFDGLTVSNITYMYLHNITKFKTSDSFVYMLPFSIYLSVFVAVTVTLLSNNDKWKHKELTNHCMCVATNRLTVTDSDGAKNYTFADATVIKGCIYLQSVFNCQ